VLDYMFMYTYVLSHMGYWCVFMWLLAYIYRPLMYSIMCDSIYNFSLNMVSEHRFWITFILFRPLPSNFSVPSLLLPYLIALSSSVLFLPVLVSSWCIYQSKPWETTVSEPLRTAQSEPSRSATLWLKNLLPPDASAVPPPDTTVVR
jgi:hypothetical protein